MNSSSICVYGDYDVDGLMSLMIFKDTLETLGCKYKCYPYISRTHDIDLGFINFCLLNQAKLAIICDTGSNNIPVLERLTSYGIELIVLDHHNTLNRYSSYPENCDIISTYLDNVEYDIDNVMCGSGIAFMVCSAFLERMSIKYDIGSLAVYSLIGMYADNIVMDTEFGRFLYQTCEGRTQVPAIIDIFTGEYMTINRRFAEWWFSPKVNAVFRREQFSLINDLFIFNSNNQDQIYKDIQELHSSTIKIIKVIVDSILDNKEYMDYGNLVVCNLSEFIRGEYPLNFILNNKGRVANAVATATGKACICVCDSGECIEGSLRDPKNNKWLQYFAPLFTAGGHPPAFGFKIPYTDWHHFEAIVDHISKTVSFADAVQNKVIDLRHNLDPYHLDEIAYENEFSHPDNPPSYVLVHFVPKKSSHKYDDYSYLLKQDGLNSLWINSDRQILSPCDIILHPYKSNKTKLRVVWG